MTTGGGERDLRPSLDNARSRVLGLEEVGLDLDGELLRLPGSELDDFGVLDCELGCLENHIALRAGVIGMEMSAWTT